MGVRNFRYGNTVEEPDDYELAVGEPIPYKYIKGIDTLITDDPKVLEAIMLPKLMDPHFIVDSYKYAELISRK